MTAFEEMGVLPELGEAITELGWTLPTDIQQEGIPAILGGADVCMAAETGTGKTGAFCLPVLQIVWETMRDSQSGKNKPSKSVENEWNLNVFDREPSLGVDRSNFTCESTHPKAWSGGRANKGVFGKGKYYYEATIVKDGLCRIGWSTIDAVYDLGTCDQGFGYGGTGKRSNAGNFDDYGESFTLNDVVGCFINLATGSIHFSKNGKEFPAAFKINQKYINSTFYPAFVLKNSRLQMNFGQQPFAFPPSNGYVGVAQAPKDETEDSPRQGFAQGAVEAKRPSNGPLCIIIEPTKELAEQVFDQINLFAKKLPSPKVRTVLVSGGIPIKDQLAALDEGVDIIACTPGRAFDLIAQGKIQLNYVRFFVLDEADSLLGPPQDLTYKINEVYQKIPRFAADGSVLQIIVCSATLHNQGVQRFADSTMHFPQWVDLKGQDAAPETVHQIVCMVDPIADKSWIRTRSKKGMAIQTDGIHAKDKIRPGSEEQETLSEGVKVLKGEYVAKAIEHFDMEQCIIFCRTKLDCDNLEDYLEAQQKGWICACLHSDRSPEERTENLYKFKEKQVRFLICTDVAARGIDVRGIPFVINVTLPPPEETSSYLHRIGRVGRADRMGLAISFAATVQEKVWYHTCRQRSCNDTRRCAIWYDEMASLGEIEEHLGITINRVTTEFDVPVDEYDGKVTYGQKRSEKEIQVELGQSAIELGGVVNELNKLERQVQLSYFRLLA